MLGQFITQYRGFRLFEDMQAPVTGRWRAARYGVTLSARTKAALIEVIRNHTDNIEAVRAAWQAQGDKILRHNVP